MKRITYKDGYKYQLYTDYEVLTDIRLSACIGDWIVLSADGLLSIKKGYAWDGPSGPTIDTKDFMRGSLVHDALYQLMREDKLPLSCRDNADRILRDICIEDGMFRVQAWAVYLGVRVFGRNFAAKSEKKPITAP